MLKYSYEKQNAVITSSSITISEGFLDVWLCLDLENGCSQGFGGYVLHLPKRTVDGCAGRFLYRIMEIAGVKKWEEINGKVIRVKGDKSKIHAIGHIIKDDWFCPDEYFAEGRKDVKEWDFYGWLNEEYIDPDPSRNYWENDLKAAWNQAVNESLIATRNFFFDSRAEEAPEELLNRIKDIFYRDKDCDD